MTSDNLRRLELARGNITRISEDLEQKHARGEITLLEKKVLLYEKLRGKDKDELLSHISIEISRIKEANTIKRNIVIAMSLTTLIITLSLIAAVNLDNHTTGYAVAMEKNRENCQSIHPEQAGEKLLPEEKAKLDPACSIKNEKQ
jgi:hypothetical protein